MSFQSQIYALVRKIPKGTVLTYAEVAQRVGRPKAYRAVGNILHKNKDPKVPCHRVIRQDGQIGGYKNGKKTKIQILKKEGYLK
jgi:O-6-methylguanine DNA methyltransferase